MAGGRGRQLGGPAEAGRAPAPMQQVAVLRAGGHSRAHSTVRAGGTRVPAAGLHQTTVLRLSGEQRDDLVAAARRLPFVHVQRLEAAGKAGLVMSSSQVVKMKANMADAAYVVDRARTATWRFDMAYVPAAMVVPLLHRYLSASRLPYAERASTLQVRRGWGWMPIVRVPRPCTHTVKACQVEFALAFGTPQAML